MIEVAPVQELRPEASVYNSANSGTHMRALVEADFSTKQPVHLWTKAQPLVHVPHVLFF